MNSERERLLKIIDNLENRPAMMAHTINEFCLLYSSILYCYLEDANIGEIYDLMLHEFALTFKKFKNIKYHIFNRNIIVKEISSKLVRDIIFINGVKNEEFLDKIKKVRKRLENKIFD